MNKRESALFECRVAGYHGDSAAFVRAYLDGKVSRKSADEAWRKGEDQRRNGVPCVCKECKGALDFAQRQHERALTGEI